MAYSKTQNHFNLAKRSAILCLIDWHFLVLCSCVITVPVNKTRSETLTDVCPAISKQNVSHHVNLHQAKKVMVL